MTEYATVTSIEFLDDEEDMYDISVEDDHSYLLGSGILSHNTVFATNLSINQARIGAKVALISLEMNRKETGRRVLSNLSGIPMQQINRVHEMSQADRRRLIEADRDFQSQVRKSCGRFTIITPEDDVSIDDVLTLLRPRGYDNIIIDYVGLLKGLDGDDQWRQMGSVARVGKRFAAANNSIVTLLAQLSEEGVIRYSRTMQEHASLMWAFNRSQQDREAGTITVRQPKARNLKSFDFTLKTNYGVMRLEDVSPSDVKSKPEEGRQDRTINVGAKRGLRGRPEARRETKNEAEYQL